MGKNCKGCNKKFRPEIPISGRFVKVNKVTSDEYTNSNYTKGLKRTDAVKYQDKLTAAGNLDEIVIASTQYVNEGLNHSRKDNIKDFARGNVLLEVGGRQYSAEVIIGTKSNGEMLLYDIVNMNAEKFDIKKKMNPKTVSSKNRTTIRQDSPSTDSISEDNLTVNSKDMQKGKKDASDNVHKSEKDARSGEKVSESELYSQGKKVLFPENKKKSAGGYIVQDEVSREFRRRNQQAYNNVLKMAKDLKKPVMVVKGLTNGKGQVLDGILTSEGIIINAESENPLSFVATHEFSHLMKKKAPKEWRKYQRYVINKLKNTATEVEGVSAYDKKYAEKEGKYEAWEIDEEIACDYIGELFSDEKALAEFIKTDRSFAVKIRDIWYSVLEFFGLKKEKVDAKSLWMKAYKASMNKTSLKKTYDNGIIKLKKEVNWRTDLNRTEYRQVEMWIRQAGTPESKRITDTACWYKGRLNGDNIFAIYSTEVANDTTILYERRGKEGEQELDILLQHLEEIENGRSIVDISKDINTLLSSDWLQEKHNLANNNAGLGGRGSNTGYASVLQGKSSKFIGSQAFRNVVKNIFDIQEERVGNGVKKSVAGTTVSEKEATESKSFTTRLLEENARLRDNIEDLYVQMNQAEGKINTRAVNDVAKSLKEKYGSKISIPTLRRELAKLYTYMSGKNVDGEVVTKRISTIAKDVIDRATETIEGGEYSELLKTIKETRIQVPESDKASFSEGYENFRKHSMGKLKLVKDGYPLDALWADLVSEYPYLFSEDITGSEERLNRILEVREELRPAEESIYKTDAEYENAVTELENAIMGSFFDIPEGKGGNYTFFEAKYTDRFSREKLKNRIDSDFTYLHGMLADPTDKRHVPEHLQAEVAAVLDCIKFETKQLDKIKDTGKEAQSPTAIKLAGISGLYEDIIRKAWGVEKNGNSKLLDEYLSEDLLELKESIPVDESGEFKRLQDMSTEELRVIGDVLRGIHHAVTKSNQAFTEGIKTTIDEASDNVVAEMATTRGKRKGSGQKLEYGKERGLGKSLNNEIVRFAHDEIQTRFWMKSNPCGFDEIKSVFIRRRRFHHEVFSSAKQIYSVERRI